MTSKNPLATQNIGSLMFKLALPAVISQIVNMLYNIVDRMYIGHIPVTGVQALTGLGLCFPIIMLVAAFSSLFGMGGAPLAAIEMGKGNDDKAEKILGNCTLLLILASFTLTIVISIFGEDLLYLFGASDATIKYALDYLKIYAFGTLFVQLSLGLNMFITTQGFSKTAMLTVLLGAVTNIILDPIFIYGFGMGVQGAALATTISQAVSAIWVILFLTGKTTKLRIKKENLKIRKEYALGVMALGLSPFIMQSTESILNICFNVSLQKYGGDLAVGAMTICGSVMQLCFMPIQGICQGAQPIISFNFGAKNMNRVKEAIKIQVIVCFTYAVTLWAFVQLFPGILVGIFNSDPHLTEYTIWAIRIYIFGLFAMGLQTACQQSFVALGYARQSLLLACLRKLVLLIPLIFILPNFFDDKVFAVFLSEPIADILAATITTVCFYRMVKRDLVQENIDA